MDQVRLPDLQTIRRFSIAVRKEHASVEEVVEALRADLESLTRATSARRAASSPEPTPKSTGKTASRSAAPKPAARKPAPRGKTTRRR